RRSRRRSRPRRRTRRKRRREARAASSCRGRERLVRVAERRRARELPRILELVDPPALLDQGIDAGRGEDSNGLVAELLLELRVAQRALQVTERFLDEELQHAPVVELDLDVDLVLA